MAVMMCVLNSAQYYDSYEATNGKTYKKGDTITLNIGSATNGSFRYFQIGGFGKFTAASDQNNPTRFFNGRQIYIKKIVKDKNDRFTFIVSAKRGINYDLYIEDALQTCEIKDCESLKNPPKPMSSDKYDRLKKIQELKESGTLTSDEFEIEKAKILKD